MLKRRKMTAADYAAMAICPSLIVLMLAALTHFVILCLYQDYSARLTYILFMFIMGATGIARISIEEGRGYASVYAGILGLAVVFVLGIASIPLVVLIWFLADRITFDCTVIDDGQDASGEGLIKSGGLFGGKRTRESVDVSLDGTTEQATAQPAEQTDTEAAPKRSRKKRRKTHKPGKTVFYLALAALPLFGLGQFLLPPTEGVRSQAAMALGLYLFATLTLLVVTSFLGLRRYLRQRGAEMPSNVAVAWIAGGAVLTAVMLLAAFALPMPGHMLAVAELPKIEALDWISPSRFGWGKEGIEPDGETSPDAARVTDPSSDNPPGGQTDEQGQAGGESEDSSGEGEKGGAPGSEGKTSSNPEANSSDDAAQGPTPSQSEQSDSGSRSEQARSQRQSEQARSDAQSRDSESAQDQSSRDDRDESRNDRDAADSTPAGQEEEAARQTEPPSQGETDDSPEGDSAASNEPSSQPRSSTPSLPNILPALGPLLKAFIVLGLIAIVVIFLLKNPQLWRQWLDALAEWMKRSERPVAASDGDEGDAFAGVAHRSFGSFNNPLHEGGDPRRAIVVTFQAFDAWAREQGDPRRDEETPAEFAARFSRQHSSFGDSLPQLADAYNRIVYGRSKATKKDIDAATAIWQQMSSAPDVASFRATAGTAGR